MQGNQDMKKSITIVMAGLLGGGLAATAWAAAGPANLRCEYRENPLGIDVAKPRLGWVISDPKSEISNLNATRALANSENTGKALTGMAVGKYLIPRGQRQTAYQILVVSAFLTLMLVGGAGLVKGADEPAAKATPASGVSRLMMSDESSGLAWEPATGRRMLVRAPELTIEDPKTHAKLPLRVKLKQHAINQSEGTFEYELSLFDGGFSIAGTGTVKLRLAMCPAKSR